MTRVPFDGYHNEFQSLTRQIQQELAQNIHEHDESIHSLFTQYEDILNQMSIEARGVDNDESKQEMLATVRMCKSQVAALKQEYKHNLSLQDKKSLFSGKEQLHCNEEMAQQQQDSLDRARQTMADTEIVANEITTELAQNRETLERTQANVSTFSSMTDKAASIIKTMSRRRGIKD